MPSPEPPVATRIVLRPLASPLALGVLALVLATVTLSSVQLGWVPPADRRVAAMTALVATVPLQLVASILGFLDRDIVVGTGMGVLTGTWATFGLATVSTPPGSTNRGLGVLLVTAGICMFVPAVAGTAKLVPATVMALAGVHFTVGGGYQLTGSATWRTATGCIGLLLGLAAFYAGLALALEGSHGHTVLPLGRRGATLVDLRGEESLAARDLAAEPGVRRQL